MISGDGPLRGWRAWVVLGLALGVLAAFAGYDLYAQRRQIEAAARDRLAHQVRLAEENLAGELQATSNTLQTIRGDLSVFGEDAAGRARLNGRLTALASSLKGVRSFLVIDGAGNCVASNRPELIGLNFRDGERYRTISRGNDPQMLYLSPPFLTPLKTWAISAGRAIQDDKGRFNGYVLAILSPDYFSLLLRSVLFAPDMHAGVIHADGLVVLREPDHEGLVGQDLSQNPRSLFAQFQRQGQPSGVFEGYSSVTGDSQLAMLSAVRPTSAPVDKYLVFAVTRDMDAILQPWHEELRWRIAALAGVALAASAALAAFQRRQRAFAAIERQQDESLRFQREQIDNFAAHAPAALAMFDRQLRYVLASRRWLADFGLEGREVVGHGLYELQPDLPERWKTLYQRAFGGEVLAFDEDQRVRADGSVQWLRWEVRPCHVPGGVVSTISVFCEDISKAKREELRLRESEQRWRFAIDGSELGLWDWDIPSGKVFLSPRWKTMRGYAEHDDVGTLGDWRQRIHPEDRDRVRADVQRLLDGEVTFYRTEFRTACKDGSWKWILDRGTVVRRDDQGKPLRAIGTQSDLTIVKSREAALELNAGVFRHSSEGIVICGPGNRIESVNEAFTQITGYPAEEVMGRNPRLLASGRHDREFFRGMWDGILREGRWQGELWNRRKNGDLFVAWLSINVDRDADGTVRHYYAIFSDITQRRQTEARLLHLTHYDALTDLPNQVLLRDEVARSIDQAERDEHTFAVLVLDLDRFKNINDSLGHTLGDKLLVEVAGRLRQVVRQQDTVARLGGDEFTVVLTDIDADGAAHAAQAIIQALAQPVRLDGNDLVVTPSIGIAVHPSDGRDTDTLLRAADSAMYRAKEEGGNAFRFHTAQMHERVSRVLELENGLRTAAAEGQLLLHYQPQLQMGGLEIVACEALVRWNHPRLGLIPPGEFIPIAEESGLIVPVGDWVMRTAAAQAKAWQDAGFAPFVMAVNVSAVQFNQPDFVDRVRAVLDDTGLAPCWLEIELTESVVAHDPQRVIRTIEQLHQLGIQLSIDDFGTGYSSLGYLKRFKIHKLKIDQSFVQDVVSNGNGASIVRAIIAMARDLGLATLAEGVETQAQFEWLRAVGCDQVQGFRFARPMPAPDFAERILSRPGWAQAAVEDA